MNNDSEFVKSGISPNAKDTLEIISKLVATFGGIISAVILIITLNNATKQ